MLGYFYFQNGDKEKALHNLRKSAELAIKFDNLPRITTLHSTLFDGKKFDKHELGSNFIAKSWIKETIESYPLSDNFKNNIRLIASMVYDQLYNYIGDINEF